MSYFLFMSHYYIAVQVFTQMNVSLTYNYMNGIAFFKHHNKLKNIHSNKKNKNSAIVLLDKHANKLLHFFCYYLSHFLNAYMFLYSISSTGLLYILE